MLSEYKTLLISVVVALIVCMMPVVGFVLYALWSTRAMLPVLVLALGVLAFLVSVLALVVAMRVRRSRPAGEVSQEVQERVYYYQVPGQQPYQQGYEQQPHASYPDETSHYS